MNNNDRPSSDERLEAYLDGRMPAEEVAQFEHLLAHDARAAEQVKLQRQIDQWLRQSFTPPKLSPTQLELLLKSEEQSIELSRSPSRLPPRRRWLLAVAAVAAGLACALLAWQTVRRPVLQPHFQPRPLAVIYREMIDQGFRPYYFCEDDDRFQLTFEARQQVPLQLTELPADRRMVGLSYVGGLSRNTTAILCYAQQHPVVVFVDRVEVDRPTAAAPSGADLRVFRKVLGELVLYEVTPLAAPMIADYLRIPGRKP